MAFVEVIIPSSNGLECLKQCLSTLEKQILIDFHTTVVDNGSSDGTAEWLQTHYPTIRIIRNTCNRGFAQAVNQAIRNSGTKYIATLNNDTQVDCDWLHHLAEVAESNESIGMVASKMLFADRPTMINSAGICVDRAGIAWDRFGGMHDGPRVNQPEEVFGPCAGAALYRRAMLDQIGLFDEDFFAYLEDVDLAWRARRSGWRCMYAPGARVLHHHSATSVEGSPFKSFHLGRNKIWLLIKNYPFEQLRPYASVVLLYDLLAVVYALVGRGDIHALLGRLAGLSSWRSMWRKRGEPPASKSRTDIEFLEPIASPGTVRTRYSHLRKTVESQPPEATGPSSR